MQVWVMQILSLPFLVERLTGFMVNPVANMWGNVCWKIIKTEILNKQFVLLTISTESILLFPFDTCSLIFRIQLWEWHQSSHVTLGEEGKATALKIWPNCTEAIYTWQRSGYIMTVMCSVAHYPDKSSRYRWWINTRCKWRIKPAFTPKKTR